MTDSIYNNLPIVTAGVDILLQFQDDPPGTNEIFIPGPEISLGNSLSLNQVVQQGEDNSRTVIDLGDGTAYDGQVILSAQWPKMKEDYQDVLKKLFREDVNGIMNSFKFEHPKSPYNIYVVSFNDAKLFTDEYNFYSSFKIDFYVNGRTS